MEPNLPTDLLSDLDLYRIQVREMRDYAMFVIDLRGNAISWNVGVEYLLGYSEEEWTGQHASIIFTPADKAIEICETEMVRARESGSVTDIRWHRRKDGTEFFAHGFMNAIRDPAGALIGYAKVLSDETARKKLQDSLTESNSALEQFAYVATHDLQEPLRTLSAYAQLLSRRYKGKLDEDADLFLSFIVQASNRMSSLVEGLLGYARETAGERHPASVTLDEDLEAALSHLAQAIEESGGTVSHDPMPVVQADRSQMVRLFQNLVGNALKYHQPGRPPKIHITAERQKSDWLISVHDNGIGFDPKYANAVFAPFHRLHPVQSYSGTGVGLAICRRIVESHGGRIWAESTPGEGTIFRFTLPSDDEKPVRLRHSPGSAPG